MVDAYRKYRETGNSVDLSHVVMQAIYIFAFACICFSEHPQAPFVMCFLALLIRLETIEYTIKSRDE